jgi:hypothetical protein
MEEETKTVKLYKGKVKLTFITDHADKHEYYNAQGKRLYGDTYFTSIIDKSNVFVPSALKKMADLLAKYVGQTLTEEMIYDGKCEWNKTKKEAADIGKEIHSLISRWINGEKKIKIPDDVKIRNGFTAFMEYQAKMKIKWLESERIVFSRNHNYVGTADALGKIGKDLVLFDFKSSKPSTMSPDGIYPEHAIQTAGYQLAYSEETKKKIAYRIIITLDKETGEPRHRIFKDNKKDIDAFLCCLNLRRRIDEIKNLAK